jgi:hypothetical protein
MTLKRRLNALKLELSFTYPPNFETVASTGPARKNPEDFPIALSSGKNLVIFATLPLQGDT